MSKINKAYIGDILQSVIDFLIRDPRHYLLSNNTNKIRNLIKFVFIVTMRYEPFRKKYYCILLNTLFVFSCFLDS